MQFKTNSTPLLRLVCLCMLLLVAGLLLLLVTVTASRVRNGAGRDNSSITIVTPTLVSEAEFLEVLRTPASSAYFDGMGVCDLRARSCQNTDEVRARVEGSQAQVLAPDQARLFELAHRADRLCFEHAVPVLAALPGIPWRFAVLDDGVEGGMPHTHGDVVCLPRAFFSKADAHCIRTLVHEKIHVCQRARPDLCERHVTEADGYVRVCLRHELGPDILRRARSNPDLGAHIYRRRDRSKSVTIFTLSDYPTSLSDGRNVALVLPCVSCSANGLGEEGGGLPDEFEHPFERMAHTLSESVI